MIEKLENDVFKKFRDLIYDASGIHFSEVNRPVLESRLKERLRVGGYPSYNDYYNVIVKDQDELKGLLDAVTTNLTSFFRNINQINSFENEVLDEIIKTRTNKRLRIWSAGCSTGEEPYTIAMVLKERLNSSWHIEIIASDISFSVLMKANEGFYPDSKVVGIPDKLLKKYFIKAGLGYQVTDEIKNLIKFDYHNLKNDSGMRNFDVVFCRNVIIYFDTKAQENVINNLYQSMNNNSYLFLGHSESLFGMNTKFVFKKVGNSCLYLKDEDGSSGK